MSIHVKNWTAKNGKNRRIRLYGVWMGMKTRCFVRSYNFYHLYGGRGITVCRDWLSFDSFREWSLQNGYRKGLTIDRIDNNGNYEPSNCRWTTWIVQNLNRRVKGVSQDQAIAICVSNVPRKIIRDSYGISLHLICRIKTGKWFLPPNSDLPRRTT